MPVAVDHHMVLEQGGTVGRKEGNLQVVTAGDGSGLDGALNDAAQRWGGARTCCRCTGQATRNQCQSRDAAEHRQHLETTGSDGRAGCGGCDCCRRRQIAQRAGVAQRDQGAAQSGLALGKDHQSLVAAMGVDQGAAVHGDRCGAGQVGAQGHAGAGVARQVDTAHRVVRAGAVEVFQGDAAAIGIADVQVIAFAGGDEVVRHLGVGGIVCACRSAHLVVEAGFHGDFEGLACLVRKDAVRVGGGGRAGAGDVGHVCFLALFRSRMLLSEPPGVGRMFTNEHSLAHSITKRNLTQTIFADICFASNRRPERKKPRYPTMMVG